MQTIILDDHGRTWDARSPALRSFLHCSLPDFDFLTYLVENLGFVAVTKIAPRNTYKLFFLSIFRGIGPSDCMQLRPVSPIRTPMRALFCYTLSARTSNLRRVPATSEGPIESHSIGPLGRRCSAALRRSI